MDEFSGRIALVTGAASGIGAATAKLLAARGADVVGFDIDEVTGTDCVRVDVTDEAAVTTAHLEVTGRHGPVDILVNCAGIGGHVNLSNMDLGEYDRVMDVNVRAAVVLSKLTLPAMIAKGAGAIINIGSTFGLMARDESLPYNMSKAAVIQLTRSMAIDLRDSGVRVNCVCPGIIKTAMTAPVFADTAGDLLRNNLEANTLRRFGEPEEVAEAIAFLASDRASFITGIALPVDGGYTAGKWMPK